MKTKGVKYWKKKAWDSFSLYVRVRDAIRTTGDVVNCVCCSCGSIKTAFGVGCIQAGHLIPGRKNSVLFSELGVNGQCAYCNSGDVTRGGLKGNWPGYYEFMMKNYNQDVINYLLMRSKQTVKLLPFELEEMRGEYQRRYKTMLETKQLLYGESYEGMLHKLTTSDDYSQWLLRVRSA